MAQETPSVPRRVPRIASAVAVAGAASAVAGAATLAQDLACSWPLCWGAGDRAGPALAGLAAVVVLFALVVRLSRIVGIQAATIAALHAAAHRDPLTGLANRRALPSAFGDLSDAANRAGHPLALLAIDLDGFKELNDRLGHAAGDAALVHVARILDGWLPRDGFLARVGGDEFVALVPCLDGTRLTATIEDLDTSKNPCIPSPLMIH